MGGLGGALKQLSIGFASRAGKTHIHTGGISQNYKNSLIHVQPALKYDKRLYNVLYGVI